MSAAMLIDRHPVLVFDLDGTLIDSAADIGRTLSLALQDCGLMPLPADRSPDLHSPFRAIVATVLASRGLAGTLAEALAEEIEVAYRQRVRTSRYPASRPYPGVMAFLAERQRRGVRMAVCTNKGYADAVRMLAHFELLGHFGVVVGSDSTPMAKPDPAPLRMALEALGAAAAESLMIGDTHVDALCARAGGVAFLWHRRGYGARMPPECATAGSFDAFGELEAGALLA